ncbi:hypothetical protein [Mucilaginibacter agri]|uniref:Uncharacterized protein n=1 Tax=Mucilaginibacter agri TaxID=2695265 RepID=A0A965ZDH4_9SPHI|nr:hypothetical protein [Mucilaginibacter agri]NCD68112.1 hypothetical protein [Mucilaginibacter agri]
METLPIYIPATFVITTLLTVALFYKASNYAKPLIIVTLLWLALQTIVSLSGFYKNSSGTPPRFTLLLIPPVLLIVVLFITKAGRRFIDSFAPQTLTLLHLVRIPVELTLYWLYLHKAVPEVMTFAGRNFDILAGITAPAIYYFGYIKKSLSPKILLAWNIACLILLGNIVVTAVLSAPFAIQKFGFEQPNIALFYFPFVWLPSFVVPTALFAHLVSIRKIIGHKF